MSKGRLSRVIMPQKYTPIANKKQDTQNDELLSYLSLTYADYLSVMVRMVGLFLRATGLMGVLEIFWRIAGAQSGFLTSYLTSKLIDAVPMLIGSSKLPSSFVYLVVIYIGFRFLVDILNTVFNLLYGINRRRLEGLYDVSIIQKRARMPAFVFEHPIMARVAEQINRRASVNVFISNLQSIWALAIESVGILIAVGILLNFKPMLALFFIVSAMIRALPDFYRTRISVLIYEASVVLNRITGWGWWEVVREHLRSLRLKTVGLYEYVAAKVVPWVFLRWDLYLAQAKWFLKWELLVTILTLGLEIVSFLMLIASALAREVSIGELMFLISTYANGVSRLYNLLMVFTNWKVDIPYIKLYLDLISGKIIQDIKRKLHAPEVKAGAVRPILKGEDIIVKDLYFRYPLQKHWVLNGINMHFPAGSKVAIVGQNGAGKTTLLKILTGFYPLYKGKVYLGETELLDTDWQQLVYIVSYLPQDVPRYEYFTPYEVIKIDEIKHHTAYNVEGLMDMRLNLDVSEIYNRIRKGMLKDLYTEIYLKQKEKAKDLEKVRKSAKLALADEFISKLPNGYFTPLSSTIPEGASLSLGQWQKLHLARVFYYPLDILILDEPTSAIDPHSGFEIMDRLLRSFGDKTVIVVSHRYSMIMDTDYVYVMKDGQVIEEGTPNQLVKQKGYFYKAYEEEKRRLSV